MKNDYEMHDDGTASILLSRGHVTRVGHGGLYMLLACNSVYRNAEGYAAVRFTDEHGVKRSMYLHRFLTNCPKGYVVDHVNGDKLCNIPSNLRVTTQRQNVWNTKLMDRSHGLPLGVSQYRKRYVAKIYDGKVRHLGTFDTVKDAFSAYLAAKRIVHPGLSDQYYRDAEALLATL